MCLGMTSRMTSCFFDRFVTGLGVGGTIAVCGLYAYEMTSRNMRGLLCCSIQLPVAFGILVSYVIGKYVAFVAIITFNSTLYESWIICKKSMYKCTLFLVLRDFFFVSFAGNILFLFPTRD